MQEEEGYIGDGKRLGGGGVGENIEWHDNVVAREMWYMVAGGEKFPPLFKRGTASI